MLDGIRGNAQSWGVKIAFGIIIVVFVFWGIGGSFVPGTVVATVNGLNISETEFRRVYEQWEQRYGQFLAGASPEDMRAVLAPVALRSLMEAKLLEADAARALVRVSVYDMRRYVEGIPLFHGPDGKFSEQAYLAALDSLRMTPAQFESDIRTELLPEKMTSLLTAGVYVDPAQARRAFDFLHEQRRVDFIFFPLTAYKDITIAEEDIVAAYTAREAEFMLPPRVRVEYVALSPQSMGDPAAVDENDVAAAYQARLQDYTLPERVHARHIILRLPENAPEDTVAVNIRLLQERLQNGEDFAALAKEASQDASAQAGGDLGWFSREQVDVAFGEAAFSLRPGEISGPVRSRFGLHLIKVEAREDSTVRSLNDVLEELRASLAAERAAGGLPAAADVVLAAALGGKSMAEAASASGFPGLNAHLTDLLDAESLARELALTAGDIRTIMHSLPGTTLDNALDTPNGKMVLRMVESLPAMTRPLEDVRGSIVDDLTLSRAREMALADAKAALANIAESATLLARVQKSDLFDRNGNLPSVGQNPEMARAVFAVPPREVGTGQWLGAFPGDEGAVLVSLAEVVAADENTWNRDGAAMISNMEAEQANMVFRAYLSLLAASAETKIVNPSILGQ